MIGIRSFQGEDGSLFDVPADQVQEFLAQAPKARPVQAFRDAAGALYDVPEDQVPEFLAQAQDVERVRSVRTLNGGTFDVADSERDAFWQEFKKNPEFEADRQEARARAVASAQGPGPGNVAVEGVKALGRGIADVATTGVPDVSGMEPGSLAAGVQVGLMDIGGAAQRAAAGLTTTPAGNVVDWAARKLGAAGADGSTQFGRWTRGVKAVGEEWGRRADELAGKTDMVGRVVRGVNQGAGALGGAGPLYEAAAPVLGIATMPAMGALGASDSGNPEQIVTAAAMGLAQQLGLGAVAGLPAVARIPAAGALFGGLTAAEGGSLEDVIAQGVFGAGLATKGAKDWTQAKDAIRPIVESNWFRKLTIRDRGLVVQSLAEQSAGMRKQGMSEGEVLRTLKRIYGNENSEFVKAMAARSQGERAQPVSVNPEQAALDALAEAGQGRGVAKPAGAGQVVGQGGAEMGPPVATEAWWKRTGVPWAPETKPNQAAAPVVPEAAMPPPAITEAPVAPEAQAVEAPVVTETTPMATMDRAQVREQLEQEASQKLGWPIRKGGNVLVTRSAAGKPYNIPIKGKVVEVLGGGMVRMSYAAKGDSSQKFQDISMSRLNEPAAATGLRKRAQELAELPAAERKAVVTAERELKQLMRVNQIFTDPNYERYLESLTGKERAIEETKYTRWQVENLAKMVGEEVDAANPVHRARLLPKAKEIAGRAGVSEAKFTAPEIVDTAFLNDGDMVWADGEWHVVSQDANVTELKDGYVRSFETGDNAMLQGVLRKGDAGYDQAREEYRIQEQENKAQRELETTEPTEELVPDLTGIEPVPPALTLESQTPEQIAAEQGRIAQQQQTQAQRDEIARRSAAPITGNAGDVAQPGLPGVEGTVEENLFNRAPTETQPTGAAKYGKDPVADLEALMRLRSQLMKASDQNVMEKIKAEAVALKAAYPDWKGSEWSDFFVDYLEKPAAAQKQREELARRATAPITGNAGDVAQPGLPGVEGTVEENLFNRAAGAPGNVGDFARTAKRMTEAGSVRGPKGTDWNVRGNQIEVGHSVTGREMGTIDLETRSVTPVRPEDRAVLEQIAESITKRTEETALESELARLKDYPFKNADKIKELEGARAARGGASAMAAETQPTELMTLEEQRSAKNIAELDQEHRLKSPIKGKTGSEIVGYEWVSKLEDTENGERRVSAWEESQTSVPTGRSIVHLFWVRTPTGEEVLMGVGAAKKALGLSQDRLYSIAKREQQAQKASKEQWDRLADRMEKQGASSPEEATDNWHKTNNPNNLTGGTLPQRATAVLDAFSRSVLLSRNGKWVRTGIEETISELKARGFQSDTPAAGTTITDVTPEGFGPVESEDAAPPRVLDRLRNETNDELVKRYVGYQVENGRVKIEETLHGWKARVGGLEDGAVVTRHATKRQDLLNEVFKLLYPDVRFGPNPAARGGASAMADVAGDAAAGQGMGDKPLYRGDAVAFDTWDKSKGELIAFSESKQYADQYRERQTSERYRDPEYWNRKQKLGEAWDLWRKTHSADQWDSFPQLSELRALDEGRTGAYNLTYRKLAGVDEIRDAMISDFKKWKQSQKIDNSLIAQAEQEFDPFTQLSGLNFWAKTKSNQKELWSEVMSPFLRSLGYDGIVYTEDDGSTTRSLFASGNGTFSLMKPPKSGGGASAMADVAGDAAAGQRADPGRVAQPANDPRYSILPIQLPELVDFARSGIGKYPQVKERLRALRGTALGLYRSMQGTGPVGIELKRSLFELVHAEDVRDARADAELWANANWSERPGGPTREAAMRDWIDNRLTELREKRLTENPRMASDVLAHEIGHWIDDVPDWELSSRGNILGHVAALNGYTKKMLAELPPNDEAALPSVKERAALRRQAEKEIGKRPAKDEADALNEWKGAVTARYGELIAEEARKRGLVTRQQVLDELNPLIAWWHGTEEIPEYFTDPKEMFADAFSVLANNPAAMRQRAPTYYKLWQSWLVERPEARELWEKYQVDATLGRVGDERDKRQMAGIAEADKAHEKQLREKLILSPRQNKDAVMAMLWSSAYPLERRAALAAKQGRGATSDRMRAAIQNERYRHSWAMGYMLEVQDKVGRMVFADGGVPLLEWQTFLQNRHIAENRQGIASMLGMNPAASNEALARQRQRLGDAAYTGMVRAQETWHELRKRYVIGLAKEKGLLDQELADLMEARAAYTHVAAVNESMDPLEAVFNERYGKAVGSQIHTQEGYLGLARDPWQATLEMDRSIITAAYRNELKAATRALLADAGEELYRPAGEQWDANAQRKVPVTGTGPRASTVVYMVNGKPESFWAPQEIVDFIDNADPASQRVLTALVNTVLRKQKGLFTYLNYGFPMLNTPRDIQDWIRNLPGWKGRITYNRYAGRAKPIVQSILSGQLTDEAAAVMRSNILLTFPEGLQPGQDRLAQVVGEKIGGRVGRALEKIGPQTALERMTAAYGLNKDWMGLDPTRRERVLDAVKAAYMNPTRRGEMTRKVAGWLYLKDQYPNMSETELQRIVQERAGSPDFANRARKNTTIDSIVMFYNPFLRGWQSAAKSFAEEPLRTTLTALRYGVLPKLLLAAIGSGLLKEVLKKAFGEWGEWYGEELRKMEKYVPRYYKENYAVHLLWWDPTDPTHTKVIFETSPLSEANRFASAAIWKLVNQEGVGSMLDYGADQLPGLNPILVLGNQWQQVLRGETPKGIGITPTQVEAGAAISPMMRETWNVMSGGMIYRIPREGVGDVALSPMEKALRLPIISNTIGRRLRVSNKGYLEGLREKAAPREHAYAVVRTQAWDDAYKLVHDGSLTTEASIRYGRGDQILNMKPSKMEVGAYLAMLPEQSAADAYYAERVRDYALEIRIGSGDPAIKAMNRPWTERIELIKGFGK